MDKMSVIPTISATVPRSTFQTRLSKGEEHLFHIPVDINCVVGHHMGGVDFVVKSLRLHFNSRHNFCVLLKCSRSDWMTAVVVIAILNALSDRREVMMRVKELGIPSVDFFNGKNL